MFERPRQQQQLRPQQTSAQPVPSTGQAARTQDFVHPGPAADLLPEAGGPGASTPHCREDLHGYSSVLSSGSGYLGIMSSETGVTETRPGT